MVNILNPKTDPDQPEVYQIRLKGHLGSQWTDWFDGLTITLEDDGNTLLTGPVADQAALHGLLKKVRDLGMPLVSVSPVEPGQMDASDKNGGGGRAAPLLDMGKPDLCNWLDHNGYSVAKNKDKDIKSKDWI